MDKETRWGWIYGLSAYLLWGVLPIYWKQIHAVDSLEILANRFIWSIVFVGLLVIGTGKFQSFLAEAKSVFSTTKTSLTMLAAAVMIAFNWGIFIWAVENGRILETSMGYYINPLMSVFLGMFFLKEKLSKLEWIAVVFAFIGIAYMVIQNGKLPWVSLAIPFTFAIYGLLKKVITVSPFTSVLLETLIISPLALAFLGNLFVQGQSALQVHDKLTLFYLAGAGVVTASPLLLFTAAAKRLPLSCVGFLQYISPSMSLVIGVFLYGEPFTSVHTVTFSCIWTGLVFFIWSQVKKF